jgi:hypothetical protein
MAISITSEQPVGQALEKEVDEDIANFEQYFCTTVDTSVPALAGAERAIIKTYLAFKLGIGPEPKQVE